MLTLTLLISTALNPIKTIFLMMLISLCSILTLRLQITTSWGPIVIFLMFMGGILVRFIIIASILPNEKSIKIKFARRILLVIPLAFLTNYPDTESVSFIIKTSIYSITNLTIFLPLICFYFLVFILLISQTSAPLRTIDC